MINEPPLVSILCITYNHESYIEQAIKGFLLQKVNFKIEIIIHDDASTDKTAEIIKEYEKENREIIKTILQTENQYSKKDGSLENAIFGACRGKYIAFCEGDDFWTDPNKLQIQADFLELNDDFGFVHHDANYYFQASDILIKNHHKKNNIIVSSGNVFKDLIKNNNIYTPTVLFKKSLIDYYLSIDVGIRSGFLMGDYVMWLEFSQHCKFNYIPKSMATYRVLENSASKTTSYAKALAFTNSYFDIRQFFLKKYPLENVSSDLIEQWRLSMCISTAIKYKMNEEAKEFASKLSTYSLDSFFKKIIVNFPFLFRYIQKKNKQ